MDILEALFEGFSGSAPSSCVPLAASGSNRKYYRLTGEDLSVVGVIGTDPDENRAFMALSRSSLCLADLMSASACSIRASMLLISGFPCGFSLSILLRLVDILNDQADKVLVLGIHFSVEFLELFLN